MGSPGRGGGGGAPPPLLALAMAIVMAAALPGASAGARCHHTRAYKLLAADCHDAGLREIPQNLRSDVQALDLTMNRIREVPAGALDRYTQLQLLYLDDNAITLVEEGALQPLTSLRVLSLSLNSLVSVPATLLQLPSLRRLVLAQNPLSAEALASALGGATADTALETLSLAQCRLRALPPLHRLARLRHLNVSGNPLEALRARQLAPLCSLREAALGEAHRLLDFCDCQLLRRWSERDGLRVLPDDALLCDDRPGAEAAAGERLCANGTAAREAEALRAVCGGVLEAQELAQRRRHLLTWAGGVAAALLVCALLATGCWCWRSRRRPSRRSAARPPLPEPKSVHNEEEEQQLKLQDKLKNDF